MTRSELISKLAQEFPQYTQVEIEKVVTLFFNEVSSALIRGDRVELRGFGTFSTKERKARKGRNPRTGEAVEVDEKRVPYFKAGKQLKERLNA